MHFFERISVLAFLFFFFFQAEDGIRDLYVTGVQTCALPICLSVLGCTASRPSNELVFAIERPPITLDPRFAMDTASENAIELILNGLTKTKIGRASCRERV